MTPQPPWPPPPPARRKMRPWALILLIVGVTLGLCLTGITVLGFIIGPTPPGKPVAATATHAVAMKPAATTSAPRPAFIPTVAPTSPAAAAVVVPTTPAATKAAPKPRVTAHPQAPPKPKPAPKPAPKPKPPHTTPPAQQGVHPGAFCAPEGAIGYTSKGTRMRCTLAAGDIRARWRRA